MSEVLKPVDVARILGVDSDRVYGWIASQELVASNVGDKSEPRWRIRREDLDDFLERRSQRARIEKPAATGDLG